MLIYKCFKGYNCLEKEEYQMEKITYNKKKKSNPFFSDDLNKLGYEMSEMEERFLTCLYDFCKDRMVIVLFQNKLIIKFDREISFYAGKRKRTGPALSIENHEKILVGAYTRIKAPSGKLVPNTKFKLDSLVKISIFEEIDFKLYSKGGDTHAEEEE